MPNAVHVVSERLRTFAGSVYRHRWLALSVSSTLAVALGIGVSFVPNRYEAKAQVYVDTQKMLKPLMSGLTYEPDIDQQVRMLARTLISRPNVERLLTGLGFGQDNADPVQREQDINRLMTRIKVAPAGMDNLNFYDISYRGDAAEDAKRLVDAVVDLFVKSGVDTKQRDSEDAGNFIEEQIRGYEKKLEEAESRLKDFKVKNFGATGVSSQDYFTRMSILSEDVAKLNTELQAAEKARDTYRQSLEGAGSPLVEDGMPSTAIAELENRIESQQKRLDELLQRFTDAHPDVINAKLLLARLTSDLAQTKQAEASGRGIAAKQSRSSVNPFYQKIRMSLVETEAQVASLRSQLSTKRAVLEQARAVGDRMPQVEAELAQLNRDYNIIRKNYDALVARREAASLGVKLSESSQLAEFRIVEPTKVSSTPVIPSRLHLAFASVAIALLGGAVAAAAVDFLRPTVKGIAALQNLSGRPVLGVVSKRILPEELMRHRADVLKFKGFIAVLMLLQMVWVGYVASTQ